MQLAVYIYFFLANKNSSKSSQSVKFCVSLTKTQTKIQNGADYSGMEQ